MADGQEWSFPRPPAAGLDLEFDATMGALREAEDHDDALRAELALAILLLSRNYELRPADYQQIFGFGAGSAALGEFRAAFSEMISESAQSRLPERPLSSPRVAAGSLRSSLLQTWLSACATRVRSLLSSLLLRSP
jgi:hypothetical protein